MTGPATECGEFSEGFLDDAVLAERPDELDEGAATAEPAPADVGGYDD